MSLLSSGPAALSSVRVRAACQRRLGNDHRLARKAAQESYQLLHRVLADAGDELGVLREAEGCLLLIVTVADHKKAFHSGGAQRLSQPAGGGVEQQLLQHP